MSIIMPKYEMYEGEAALLAEITHACAGLSDFPDDGHLTILDDSHAMIFAETFDEATTDDAGNHVVVKRDGKVWSDAIQKMLDQHQAIYIPYCSEPLYLNKPIVLRSNYTLKIHPDNEIRLKPGTNTCMIRNEAIVCGAHKPADQLEVSPDTNIRIEGGIWTTLANGRNGGNGNSRGHADSEGSVQGLFGVIALHNTKHIVICNLVIKECSYFGIHIGNTTNLLVDNIQYVNHHRDGVHLDGPIRYGIIRNISGRTGDDLVALNAWDWQKSSVTFGSIEKVLVENVWSADGWPELRLLPGTKRFPDGQSVRCEIKHCMFRNIHNVHTIKIYDQPNLEMGRDKDYSTEVGYLDNIYFSCIVFTPFIHANHYCKKDAFIEVCANIGHIYLNAIDLHGIRKELSNFAMNRLLAVGPMSSMYKIRRGGKEEWVELFRPEFNCVIEHLHVQHMQVADELTISELIYERSQSEESTSTKAVGVIRQIEHVN